MEYVGDSSITCPRVRACYVSCQADCNDLQPAKGGGRCFSRLACQGDILPLMPSLNKLFRPLMMGTKNWSRFSPKNSPTSPTVL